MKLFILLALLLAFVAGQSVGPNSPTVTAQSGAGLPWANPNDALNQDGISANVTLAIDEVSQDLFFTDFGFNVDSGMQIFGVTVNIRRSADGSNVFDDALQLVIGGTAVPASDRCQNTNDCLTDYTTGTPALDILGNIADTWGIGPQLTPAVVNDPGFGLLIRSTRLSGGGNAPRNVLIDSVTVTLSVGLPGSQPGEQVFQISNIRCADVNRDGGCSDVQLSVADFDTCMIVEETRGNTFLEISCNVQNSYDAVVDISWFPPGSNQIQQTRLLTIRDTPSRIDIGGADSCSTFDNSTGFCLMLEGQCSDFRTVSSTNGFFYSITGTVCLNTNTASALTFSVSALLFALFFFF